MPSDWSSQQYLKFERERTVACYDLVRRIELNAPRQIVDLGCGPGNSTTALAQRWPAANITGVDRSPDMLAAARSLPGWISWVEGDLSQWVPDGPCDLVFSNAALHWIPDHRHEVPRLWKWIAPGGALAFQVPANDTPLPAWIQAISTVCARARWRDRRGTDEARANVLALEEYDSLLAPEAQRVDLWDTIYLHVLAGPEAIVEWARGAGLRPWLQQLADDKDRDEFLGEYLSEIRRRYPLQSGGQVLFPFLRRFVVAYR